MQDLLNHNQIYFPKRHDQLYTLKEFLDEITNEKYHLPIIVNITSLNNYGRALKNILSKNTLLLLTNIGQLDSILAEYHRSQDGRSHSYRHRLTITQGKRTTRVPTKFRTMKKLSKSLASLTTTYETSTPNNDDYFDSDDNTYHQRNLVKILNDKRSSSIPLCRIPTQYERFFELLNENNQSIAPYHKLTDLILINYDDNNPEKRIEKWPHAFFLRSSCSAYTKKYASQFLHSTKQEKYSNASVSTDSCYGSSSDLDSQKNIITLNDEIQILQSGQILTILGDCYAVHTGISDKQLKEQQRSISPSPSYTIPSWIRDKSKMLFSKKRRQSQSTDTISSSMSYNRSFSKNPERYLKCQTQQGDIVYICLNESGLFSPLNFQTHRFKSSTELTSMDISGVFQLKNLLSNFRFPISVRHLDGSISFDNIYSLPSINRYETPTKLRLLMPYHEHVIFACPLNILQSKSSKTSLPYIVIPLSVNADIEIQPCINMYDISKTEDFRKIIEICFQLIEQYQTEISLIHFPLQFTNNINQSKQPLDKKRSQSTSFLESFDEGLKPKFRHSDEPLNTNDYYTDNSSSSVTSRLRYRDSIETIKQKLSSDAEQRTLQRSNYYSKTKNDKYRRYSWDEYTNEDEIYEDVDKIYDYIRSGDITDDVQQIQAKEQIYNITHTIDIPSSTTNKSERQIPTTSCNPGKLMINRFSPEVINSRSSEHSFDYHSCKNDGNVDDDQAHALYLASKQRTKTNSQDLSNSKPNSKLKRTDKH